MPLSTLLISWLLGGKIPFFVSSNSQLFVYGCGLPSPSPCSSVTVNRSALQLICLAKYGFKDLGVSAVQQGLTVTASACLKLSVWGGWHTLDVWYSVYMYMQVWVWVCLCACTPSSWAEPSCEGPMVCLQFLMTDVFSASTPFSILNWPWPAGAWRVRKHSLDCD